MLRQIFFSVNEEGPYEPAVVYVYHEKWMSSTSQD